MHYRSVKLVCDGRLQLLSQFHHFEAPDAAGWDFYFIAVCGKGILCAPSQVTL